MSLKYLILLQNATPPENENRLPRGGCGPEPVGGPGEGAAEPGGGGGGSVEAAGGGGIGGIGGFPSAAGEEVAEADQRPPDVTLPEREDQRVAEALQDHEDVADHRE